MPGKRYALWMVLVGVVAVLGLSGCCRWCENNCPNCHPPAPACYQPTYPAAYAPAPPPAPVQTWSQPAPRPMNCQCQCQ
jgi:hypothetical protein